MDEGIGDPAAIAVLSSAVLAAAQSTLGSMGLSATFWGWHRDVMLRYAEAMQFEAEVRNDPDGYDEAAFERVLDRSRPLEVPGVAVLDTAGGWSLQPDFERMIMAATGALQIVNDLDHVAKDLAMGNRTWVHTLLGVHCRRPADPGQAHRRDGSGPRSDERSSGRGGRVGRGHSACPRRRRGRA